MKPVTTSDTSVEVIDYAGASSAPPSVRVRRWIQATLACSATLVYPGLGHMTAGKWRRGAAFLLAGMLVEGISILCMMTPALLVALPILLVVALGLFLAAIVDAVRCGWRAEQPLLRHRAYGVIATIFMLILFLLGGVRRPVALYLKAYEVEKFVLGWQSMVPTLQPGDCFLSDKDEPWGRWDIVTYERPGNDRMICVSRVVGLPGETVELIDGEVYIDGQSVPVPAGVGPYTCRAFPVPPDHPMRWKPGTGCVGNPITLADDEVFVLGDNTQSARDGRYWTEAAEGHQLGALPQSSVTGKVTAIYFPFSRWRMLK